MKDNEMDRSDPAYQNWRDRINNLKEIPGERKTDFNALWQRLETKLEADKPQKKRTVLFYWIAAAACLLIALLLYVNTNRTIDRSNLVKKVEPQEKRSNRIEVANTTVKPIVKAQVEKGVNILPDNSGKEIVTKHQAVQIPKKIELVIDTTANIIANNSLPVNTPVALTVPKVSTHVMHINELTLPRVITTPVARNSFKHTADNKLSDQDTWQQENTSPLIKINLSPQN